MTSTRKLWSVLAASLIFSFGTSLWAGGEIYQNAPPMPEQVVTTEGAVVYTRADIERGRQVWQSIGGMQLGSIWGHGGYVAPDWSADWLHRELVALLDRWAADEFGAADFTALSGEQRSLLEGRLRERMRQNTYDPETGTITLGPDRAAAIASVSAHYEGLFGSDPATADLRENYAMKNDTVADPENRRLMSAFFWWTAWAAATERPGTGITYTNNWPSEPLIGNRPPASTFLWSAFSVTLLLAGIGALGWHTPSPTGGARSRIGFQSSTRCGMSRRCPPCSRQRSISGAVGPIHRADPVRSDDRALPGRRPVRVRLRAGAGAALLDHAHLAHPAGGPADRRGVARHRTLHRPCGLWP